MRTSSREIARASAARRRLWSMGAAGLVTALAVAGGVYALGADDTHGEVVRVIDGDTLVALVDGEETTVRLLNVDTPETKDPDEDVQCLGPEATQFLTERLPAGTVIELEYDQERLDRYDRTLAGVYESDSLINAEIAAEGLGVPVLFEPNDRFLPEVEEAARSAQEQAKGLFAEDIACTLPAQLQALDSAAGQIPSTVDGDPAAALAEATTVVADLDVFLEGLEPEGLPGLGNAVLALPLLEGYRQDLADEATAVRERAETARGTLDQAKTEHDEEQERLEEERVEKERLAREEQERLEREEQERLDREEKAAQEDEERREREAQKPAPSPPASSGSGSGGGSSSGGGGGGTSTPAPQPKPAPKPDPAPEKSSGCTPYGPEISYSDDGGYSGKRYGMPGGQTFRKCR